MPKEKSNRKISATTVRLEEPVFAQLKQLARERQVSLNEAFVNMALAALDAADLKAAHLPEPTPPVGFKEHEFNLDAAAKDLAEAVTQGLARDLEWARTAIIKAQLAPLWAAVFGHRFEEHIAEKKHLANRFHVWLLERIKFLQSRHPTVYLLIDSGTTLYWFFKELASALDTWPGSNPNLVIVTNNIPGTVHYLTHSHSKERPECRIVPGVAVEEYAAILGLPACEALCHLKKEAGRNDSVLVGLLAGTWLSATRERCAVPMTKTKEHIDFKKTLSDVCSEVYLVVNLAKIFTDVDTEEVNELLDDANLKLKSESYSEAVNPKVAARVRLVSTSRSAEQVLAGHSGGVERLLGVRRGAGDSAYAQYVDGEYGQIPHMLFGFDDFTREAREKEFKVEFPRESSRQCIKFLQHFLVSKEYYPSGK